MNFIRYISVAAIGILIILGIFFFGKTLKKRWIVYATTHSKHWRERDQEIRAVAPGTYKIIFLGNSLTELFYLDQYFDRKDILNCGIVGDFSEGLLLRADAITRLKPEKLFIDIGINDIVEGISLQEICANYTALIHRVQNESPTTKIFIQSNLPVIIRRPSVFVGDKNVNDKVREQNENLRKLANREKVTFIDLYDPFIRSGPLEDLLVDDGIHLTHKAYDIWKMCVEPYVYENNDR